MEKIAKTTFEQFKRDMSEYKPFTTGYKEIDKYLSSARGGSIITIGSRPAMGKTMFAISIVNHLLKENRKVCYFNLSEPKVNIYTKILSDLTKTDFMKTQHCLRMPNEMLPKIQEGIDELSSRELYISDEAAMSIEELEEHIKEIKPDVAVIDYIQLLEMPKSPNITESTNLAIKEVKRIAKENNVLVLLISQLSRALEQRVCKRPILSDLRNGSALEEMSDVVMFLYRESYYDPNVDEAFKDIAEIMIAKNQYGPTDCCLVNMEKGIFSDRALNYIFEL